MEHSVAYIIGFRYACDACTAHNINAPESEKKRATTFHAWDPGCLKRLPEYASKEFPFILTHHVGINTSYTGTPTNSLVSGGDFAAAANRVGEGGSRPLATETSRQQSPQSFGNVIGTPRTAGPNPSCRTSFASTMAATGAVEGVGTRSLASSMVAAGAGAAGAGVGPMSHMPAPDRSCSSSLASLMVAAGVEGVEGGSGASLAASMVAAGARGVGAGVSSMLRMPAPDPFYLSSMAPSVVAPGVGPLPRMPAPNPSYLSYLASLVNAAGMGGVGEGLGPMQRMPSPDPSYLSSLASSVVAAGVGAGVGPMPHLSSLASSMAAAGIGGVRAGVDPIPGVPSPDPSYLSSLASMMTAGVGGVGAGVDPMPRMPAPDPSYWVPFALSVLAAVAAGAGAGVGTGAGTGTGKGKGTGTGTETGAVGARAGAEAATGAAVKAEEGEEIRGGNGMGKGAGAEASESIAGGSRHGGVEAKNRGCAPLKRFRGCRECGHHKGAWSQYHPEPRSGQYRCTMPVEQWRSGTEKVLLKMQRKVMFPPCKCPVCRGSYKEY
eukprot:jgi/Undpi1/784/HiC_scaffold_10.g04248.m1